MNSFMSKAAPVLTILFLTSTAAAQNTDQEKLELETSPNVTNTPPEPNNITPSLPIEDRPRLRLIAPFCTYALLQSKSPCTREASIQNNGTNPYNFG